MTVENRPINGIGPGDERGRVGAPSSAADREPFELPPADSPGIPGTTTDARTLAQLSGFDHEGHALDQPRLDAAVRFLLRSRDLAAQVSAEAAGSREVPGGASAAGDGTRAVAAYLEIQKL